MRFISAVFGEKITKEATLPLAGPGPQHKRLADPALTYKTN